MSSFKGDLEKGFEREKRLKEEKEDGIFYLRHNKITAACFKNVLFLTCEISLERQKEFSEHNKYSEFAQF